MSLLLPAVIVAGSVLGGVGLNFYLLQKAHQTDTLTWYAEHVLCPLLRVIVLLIVVSQVYPSIDAETTSLDFWRHLGERQQLQDIVNILFFGGLLLAFIPIINHPVFALPIQSMLTIALVFHWQYGADSPNLWPSLFTLLKIVAWMLLAWLITRELGIRLSRKIDRWLVVSGSIRPLTDSLFMLLQIPVMLIYGEYLAAQPG